MAFPTSITGQLVIPMDQLSHSIDKASRLQAALISETVGDLRRMGNSFTFRHRSGFHRPIARPGGQWWLFALFDAGSFELCEDAAAVTIRYRLSTSRAFWIVTLLAIIVGSLIQFNSGPDHAWGFAVGIGLWLLMFAAQYLSKRSEMRRWFLKIMTAETLPSPAAIALDVPG